MKIAIVYSSLTGNTKMLAEAIRDNLNKEDIIYCGKPSSDALEADLLYVGFWTNQGTCDDESKKFLAKLNNKQVFLFGTAGFSLSDEYLDSILLHTGMNLNDSNKVIGKYICIGKMPERVKAKYLAKLNEDPNNVAIERMLKNYEKALGHPNLADLNNLVKKIKELGN